MASSIDVPSPSVTDDITKRSKPLSSESTSGRKPGQEHVLLEPEVPDLRLELARAARPRRR